MTNPKPCPRCAERFSTAETLALRATIREVATVYDQGHDDSGATGQVLRNVLAGMSPEDALGLDMADPIAQAMMQTARYGD